MSVINKNIIATLAYFDVFNYPLTRGEMFLFMTVKCDQETFNSALSYLLINDSVYCFDTFFTLKNDPQIAIRRRTGNQKATELIKVAHKVGRLLIKFPYVRGIAISGSLSKNFADDNSDIDLFIITAANRLWIARTLLHMLKKLSFLVNKEQLFCMNYFIDEEALQIAEKNIYTATEVVTLIPIEGDLILDQFYSANAWTRFYLPNNCMRISSARPLKRYLFKIIIEALFNNSAGNTLDNVLKKITAYRWNKKTEQGKVNSKGIIMGMKADKHFAKPDPANFQQRLIERYENRLNELLQGIESSMAQV
ncbi:hypothetical protein BDD43_3746 [Mucilaginibacter gracilis]|uniref:Polymerase nucleotidyl transferase domain-containing protein n=1 Tax=Mucilaginibacter gracilis TaxID=423350 RepID=A0A495J3H6_9SPHI|nr:nucleotidyltransferase domain-containing protein [Mucilaginibacter gracilis]RKR83536.1 hypothetical protein BDD43_3746 [Mucilaginibacter gracilis]